MSDRDWTEDFPHENGQYQNTCATCKNGFIGHKRRTVCKVCDASIDCICEGNWRKLVKECENLIGKEYIDSQEATWTFFGLVWGESDLYYGMYNGKREAQVLLLSCVGDLDGHGFRKKE